MPSLSRIFTLILLAQPVLADDDSAAVNERLPVTRHEMEGHWNLDCSASWKALLGAVDATDTGADCGVKPALLRELELCAFIYQPPGEVAHSQCPDFRSATDRLQRSSPGPNCDQLSRWLVPEEGCAGNVPGK